MPLNRNRVDFENDIPSAEKTKKIIFYPNGLKIYGVLPYLLNRKLKGEFASSLLYEDESNFTVVGYQQKPEYVQTLVNWLYSGAGFEWAIAQPHEKLRATPEQKPETYKPPESFQSLILKVFGAAVETCDPHDPKPWDVVLGGFKSHAQPQETDAVLGGSSFDFDENESDSNRQGEIACQLDRGDDILGLAFDAGRR